MSMPVSIESFRRGSRFAVALFVRDRSIHNWTYEQCRVEYVSAGLKNLDGLRRAFRKFGNHIATRAPPAPTARTVVVSPAGAQPAPIDIADFVSEKGRCRTALFAYACVSRGVSLEDYAALYRAAYPKSKASKLLSRSYASAKVKVAKDQGSDPEVAIELEEKDFAVHFLKCEDVGSTLLINGTLYLYCKRAYIRSYLNSLQINTDDLRHYIQNFGILQFKWAADWKVVTKREVRNEALRRIVETYDGVIPFAKVPVRKYPRKRLVDHPLTEPTCLSEDESSDDEDAKMECVSDSQLAMEEQTPGYQAPSVEAPKIVGRTRIMKRLEPASVSAVVPRKTLLIRPRVIEHAPSVSTHCPCVIEHSPVVAPVAAPRVCALVVDDVTPHVEEGNLMVPTNGDVKPPPVNRTDAVFEVRRVPLGFTHQEAIPNEEKDEPECFCGMEDHPWISDPCHMDNCRHKFHLECISTWANMRLARGERPTCPLCRAEFMTVRVGDRRVTFGEDAPPPQIYVPQIPYYELQDNEVSEEERLGRLALRQRVREARAARAIDPVHIAERARQRALMWAELTRENTMPFVFEQIRAFTLSTLRHVPTCVICTEPVHIGCTLSPCEHNQFHAACIGQWLHISSSCPLCNCQVTRADGEVVPPVVQRPAYDFMDGDIFDENEVHCIMCGNQDGSFENPILLCDHGGCPNGTHLVCDRLSDVPVGNWYCYEHRSNITDQNSPLSDVTEEDDDEPNTGRRMAAAIMPFALRELDWEMIEFGVYTDLSPLANVTSLPADVIAWHKANHRGKHVGYLYGKGSNMIHVIDEPDFMLSEIEDKMVEAIQNDITALVDQRARLCEEIRTLRAAQDVADMEDAQVEEEPVLLTCRYCKSCNISYNRNFRVMICNGCGEIYGGLRGGSFDWSTVVDEEVDLVVGGLDGVELVVGPMLPPLRSKLSGMRPHKFDFSHIEAERGQWNVMVPECDGCGWKDIPMTACCEPGCTKGVCEDCNVHTMVGEDKVFKFHCGAHKPIWTRGTSHHTAVALRPLLLKWDSDTRRKMFLRAMQFVDVPMTTSEMKACCMRFVPHMMWDCYMREFANCTPLAYGYEHTGSDNFAPNIMCTFSIIFQFMIKGRSAICEQIRSRVPVELDSEVDDDDDDDCSGITIEEDDMDLMYPRLPVPDFVYEGRAAEILGDLFDGMNEDDVPGHVDTSTVAWTYNLTVSDDPDTTVDFTDHSDDVVSRLGDDEADSDFHDATTVAESTVAMSESSACTTNPGSVSYYGDRDMSIVSCAATERYNTWNDDWSMMSGSPAGASDYAIYAPYNSAFDELSVHALSTQSSIVWSTPSPVKRARARRTCQISSSSVASGCTSSSSPSVPANCVRKYDHNGNRVYEMVINVPVGYKRGDSLPIPAGYSIVGIDIIRQPVSEDSNEDEDAKMEELPDTAGYESEVTQNGEEASVIYSDRSMSPPDDDFYSGDDTVYSSSERSLSPPYSEYSQSDPEEEWYSETDEDAPSESPPCGNDSSVLSVESEDPFDHMDRDQLRAYDEEMYYQNDREEARVRQNPRNVCCRYCGQATVNYNAQFRVMRCRDCGNVHGGLKGGMDEGGEDAYYPDPDETGEHMENIIASSANFGNYRGQYRQRQRRPRRQQDDVRARVERVAAERRELARLNAERAAAEEEVDTPPWVPTGSPEYVYPDEVEVKRDDIAITRELLGRGPQQTFLGPSMMNPRPQSPRRSLIVQPRGYYRRVDKSLFGDEFAHHLQLHVRADFNEHHQQVRDRWDEQRVRDRQQVANREAAINDLKRKQKDKKARKALKLGTYPRDVPAPPNESEEDKWQRLISNERNFARWEHHLKNKPTRKQAREQRDARRANVNLNVPPVPAPVSHADVDIEALLDEAAGIAPSVLPSFPLTQGINLDESDDEDVDQGLGSQAPMLGRDIVLRRHDLPSFVPQLAPTVEENEMAREMDIVNVVRRRTDRNIMEDPANISAGQTKMAIAQMTNESANSIVEGVTAIRRRLHTLARLFYMDRQIVEGMSIDQGIRLLLSRFAVRSNPMLVRELNTFRLTGTVGVDVRVRTKMINGWTRDRNVRVFVDKDKVKSRRIGDIESFANNEALMDKLREDLSASEAIVTSIAELRGIVKSVISPAMEIGNLRLKDDEFINTALARLSNDAVARGGVCVPDYLVHKLNEFQTRNGAVRRYTLADIRAEFSKIGVDVANGVSVYDVKKLIEESKVILGHRIAIYAVTGVMFKDVLRQKAVGLNGNSKLDLVFAIHDKHLYPIEVEDIKGAIVRGEKVPVQHPKYSFNPTMVIKDGEQLEAWLGSGDTVDAILDMTDASDEWKESAQQNMKRIITIGARDFRLTMVDVIMNSHGDVVGMTHPTHGGILQPMLNYEVAKRVLDKEKEMDPHITFSDIEERVPVDTSIARMVCTKTFGRIPQLSMNCTAGDLVHRYTPLAIVQQTTFYKNRVLRAIEEIPEHSKTYIEDGFGLFDRFHVNSRKVDWKSLDDCSITDKRTHVYMDRNKCFYNAWVNNVTPYLLFDSEAPLVNTTWPLQDSCAYLVKGFEIHDGMRCPDTMFTIKTVERLLELGYITQNDVKFQLKATSLLHETTFQQGLLKIRHDHPEDYKWIVNLIIGQLRQSEKRSTRVVLSRSMDDIQAQLQVIRSYFAEQDGQSCSIYLHDLKKEFDMSCEGDLIEVVISQTTQVGESAGYVNLSIMSNYYLDMINTIHDVAGRLTFGHMGKVVKCAIMGIKCDSIAITTPRAEHADEWRVDDGWTREDSEVTKLSWVGEGGRDLTIDQPERWHVDLGEDDEFDIGSSILCWGPGGSGKTYQIFTKLVESHALSAPKRIFVTSSTNQCVWSNYAKVSGMFTRAGIEFKMDGPIMTTEKFEIMFDTLAYMEMRLKGKYARPPQFDMVIVDEVGTVPSKLLRMVKSKMDLVEGAPIILAGDFQQTEPIQGTISMEDTKLLKELSGYRRKLFKIVLGRSRYKTQATVDVMNEMWRTGVVPLALCGGRVNADLSKSIAYTNRKVNAEIARQNKTRDQLRQGDKVYVLRSEGHGKDMQKENKRLKKAGIYTNAKYEIVGLDGMYFMLEGSATVRPVRVHRSRVQSELCITTHKIQGQEINHPFNIYELAIMHTKTRYTAISRATDIRFINCSMPVDQRGRNDAPDQFKYMTLEEPAVYHLDASGMKLDRVDVMDKEKDNFMFTYDRYEKRADGPGELKVVIHLAQHVRKPINLVPIDLDALIQMELDKIALVGDRYQYTRSYERYLGHVARSGSPRIRKATREEVEEVVRTELTQVWATPKDQTAAIVAEYRVRNKIGVCVQERNVEDPYAQNAPMRASYDRERIMKVTDWWDVPVGGLDTVENKWACRPYVEYHKQARPLKEARELNQLLFKAVYPQVDGKFVDDGFFAWTADRAISAILCRRLYGYNATFQELCGVTRDCYLSFDIDRPLEDGEVMPDVNAVIREFVRALTAALLAQNCVFDESQMYVCLSESPRKLSMHVVYHKEVFPSLVYQRAFVKDKLNPLIEDGAFPLLVYKEKSIVDGAIYTKRRAMRMPYCKKALKDNTLIPMRVVDGVYVTYDLAGDFRDPNGYLVTYGDVMANEEVVKEYKKYMCQAESRVSYYSKLSDNPSQNVQKRGRGRKSAPCVAKAYSALTRVQRLLVDALMAGVNDVNYQFEKIDVDNVTKGVVGVRLYRRAPGQCKCCERAHDNQNAIVSRRFDGGWYLHCWAGGSDRFVMMSE